MIHRSLRKKPSQQWWIICSNRSWPSSENWRRSKWNSRRQRALRGTVWFWDKTISCWIWRLIHPQTEQWSSPHGIYCSQRNHRLRDISDLNGFNNELAANSLLGFSSTRRCQHFATLVADQAFSGRPPTAMKYLASWNNGMKFILSKLTQRNCSRKHLAASYLDSVVTSEHQDRSWVGMSLAVW